MVKKKKTKKLYVVGLKGSTRLELSILRIVTVLPFTIIIYMVLNELSNHLNVYTKYQIPKMFGNVVTNLAKPQIISSMTKFQIGNKPGNHAQEHYRLLYELNKNAKVQVKTAVGDTDEEGTGEGLGRHQ